MEKELQDGGELGLPTGLAFWMVVMGEHVLGEIRRALAPFGINPVQFSILDACSRGDANTVTSIAQPLPIEPSSISRQADQLHMKGLLERRRQTSDRRVVTLRLSSKGKELMPKLQKVVAAEEARVGSSLSDAEKAALVSIAKKIVMGLEKKR